MKHLKTITILFILSLLTLISLTTCKKYPQDGKISWSSIKHRLTSHKWILKEYLINGEDDIERAYINSSGYYWSFKNGILEFRNKALYKDNGGPFDGGFNSEPAINSDPSKPLGYSRGIGFAWNVGKKYISIMAMGSSTEIPFFAKDTANTYWEIRKMTDKELIIKQIDNKNRIIELKFFK